MRAGRSVLIAAALVAIVSLAAHAQRGVGGSVDAFDLGPIPNAATYGPMLAGPLPGVSLRSAQTLDPAVRNLVMVCAGQSNMEDVAPSVYTPANPSKIDNFNIYDGAVYVGADPLMGASRFPVNNGNPCLRVADSLITANKFDRVVIAPVAIGATAVADWAPGAFLATRIPITFQRLAARGMVAGTNVTLIAVWGQGENDTVLATSQAAYTASMQAIIDASRAAGFAGRWFIASQSYISGLTSANVTNAQAAVVNHGASVWAGPNADALIGNVCVGSTACRVADDIHWSDTGSASYAAGWVTAFAASGAPF